MLVTTHVQVNVSAKVMEKLCKSNGKVIKKNEEFLRF